MNKQLSFEGFPKVTKKHKSRRQQSEVAPILPLVIRKATTEDKDTIIKLWRANETMLGKPQHPALNSKIAEGTCHVAELNGDIVGFVLYNARKRDSGSTIYYIATSEAARNQGVGAALLWSVPCPIRLKVTADNASAIKFYEHHHMKRVSEETSRTGRLLYVYELKTLFIQVAGNNYDFPALCRNAGIAYGSRHDDKIRAWPAMIDINWNKYEWTKYLNILKTYKPLMAMVADYERPEQKDTMLKQVQDLRDLGILRIMVCPKFSEAIADIPSDCVIAVSVPSEYAGYMPPLEQLKNKRLHLLGGSPVAQRDCLLKVVGAGAIVISADGNSHTANTGGVWQNGKWNFPKNGTPYHDLIQVSAVNISKMFQSIEEWQPSLFAA